MGTSYKQKDTGAQQLSATSSEKPEAQRHDDYIKITDFMEFIKENNESNAAMFVQAIKELYDLETKRNADPANIIKGETFNPFAGERSAAQQRFKNSYPRIR